MLESCITNNVIDVTCVYKDVFLFCVFLTLCTLCVHTVSLSRLLLYNVYPVVLSRVVSVAGNCEFGVIVFVR